MPSDIAVTPIPSTAAKFAGFAIFGFGWTIGAVTASLFWLVVWVSL